MVANYWLVRLDAINNTVAEIVFNEEAVRALIDRHEPLFFLLLLRRLGVKVSINYNSLYKIDEMDLLSVVLAVNRLAQSLHEEADDQVGDLGGQGHLVVNRLHHELHELTGRRVDGLCRGKQLAVERLDGLPDDELQGDADDCVDVLVLAVLQLLVIVVHFAEVRQRDVVELLVELVSDVLRNVLFNDVLDKLRLGVEDDVSELAEVFNDILRHVVFFQEEDLAGEAFVDSVVVHELLQQWVEDAQEVVLRFC